ncbi:MAG: hypothetical protein AAFY46_13835 [Planctomycetota bacterium]
MSSRSVGWTTTDLGNRPAEMGFAEWLQARLDLGQFDGADEVKRFAQWWVQHGGEEAPRRFARVRNTLALNEAPDNFFGVASQYWQLYLDEKNLAKLRVRRASK